MRVVLAAVISMCIFAEPAFGAIAVASNDMPTPSPRVHASKKKPVMKPRSHSSSPPSTVGNGPTGAGKPGTGGPGATAGTNSNGNNLINGH